MRAERRYLCAYFPQWSIDVTRRSLCSKNVGHNPASILLTSVVANQPIVSRSCTKAMQAGVRINMPLPLARALCPDAYIEAFDPVRDSGALLTLARWCLRFSPLVGLDYELLKAKASETLHDVGSRHYGLTIDLTGTERLHGDITQFSHSLHALLKGRARIAVAPTIGGCWALSRYSTNDSPSILLSLGDLRDSLRDLSPHALRIDHHRIRQLRDVGITRIGEILDLPRHALAQRFGKKLVYRLEQALGEADERLCTIDSPRRYACSRIFEPPLTNRRGVSIAIQHLFRALVARLSAEKKAAKYFQLTVRDSDDHTTVKELSLAAATSDVALMPSIIEPLIETLKFFGEVRELRLIANHIESTSSEQSTFSASEQKEPTERERRELMNNFCVRIGKDRITRAQLHQSYIPERSFSYESALNSREEATVAEQCASYSVEERPSILFPSPEPISAISMLPDKPPSYIQWRGRRFSVITGIGPERIAPEWWHLHPQKDRFAERDYFKIQDELGRWLWVFRDQNSLEWFLHGMWA
jgi:protein ImuB